MFFRIRMLLVTLVAAAMLHGCTSRSSSTDDQTKPAKSDVPTQDADLTSEQFEQALTLHHRSIGHLENKEWTAAMESLSQLAELLPSHLLARRNLAVGRVLVLTDRESPYKHSGSPADAAQFTAAVQQASNAIQLYSDVATTDEDRALARLLRGKLLVHADTPAASRIDEGLQELRAAAEILPEAADFQFALAMAMDGHRDYADPNAAKAPLLLQSLQTAFQLAPQNLFALQKLMQRQALSLNSKNPETQQLALQITQTLESAIKLLAPLNEKILEQRRVNLQETIQTALEKFDGSNPAALMGPAMMTGNLLLPEVATQIDQRRIHKDLLEYIVVRFEDDFLQAAQAAGAIAKLEPTVVQGFEQSSGLPDLNGVTDLQMQDMDLDGFDDLIVARQGKLEIWSRGPSVQADWQLLLTSPDASIDVTKFLLADVDRDFDKAISDVKTPSLLRDADGDQKIPQDPAGKNRWYDTDLDVIAYGSAGVVIFRNTLSEDGTRSLEILPQAEDLTAVNSVVAADLEADGDLDLIFASDTGMTLWKNIDGTRFENMNSAASLPQHGLSALAVVDWNFDVAIDVVGCGADGQCGVLENMLHGRFRWLPLPDHSGHSVFAVGDRKGTSEWAWITADSARILQLGDLDNDGFRDRIVGTDQEILWTRGTPDGGLAEESQTAIATVSAQTIAVADYDDDGDLDLIYVDADGTPGLLINNGGNSNDWIDVVARAVPDDPQFPSNRVNMHAIGSVIEMRAEGLYHGQVITSPKVHLGLGKQAQADIIRIIWTDGIPQNITVPKLLQPRIGILAPQILKGSCPYIYTWTGDKFEYFSDCLWAAPIGLVQASGEIAPTREWENLLIPGSALVEKDGRYLVQLTEELWEIAYFDQVQLTAIDRPADVQIFTNEKVGPPEMAQHRIHTVQNARLPAAITDTRGRDLLPELTEADGNYVQAFEGRILQGLTDTWAMEFDLGQLPQAGNATEPNIRLFLIGWVFPTDTSLNRQIQQNPNLAPPAPPAIQVPDGQGGWKVARPFIGFPSGKTKAMVIDISDIFDASASDDFRFRITSSMELYWDQAFFTVNEVDADTVVHACELVDSDLQFRGFSRRTYADNSLFRGGYAPEGYDHASVTTAARWPPIAGRFTKYGTVSPLLLHHDDQMVVMGPGDALTLEFLAPNDPPPAGWKRDFVLSNVGYDKDADLNTVYGQSSEPFPFRAMQRYPAAASSEIPTEDDQQPYLDDWQTRRYSPHPFWNAVRNR